MAKRADWKLAKEIAAGKWSRHFPNEPFPVNFDLGLGPKLTLWRTSAGGRKQNLAQQATVIIDVYITRVNQAPWPNIDIPDILLPTLNAIKQAF